MTALKECPCCCEMVEVGENDDMAVCPVCGEIVWREAAPDWQPSRRRDD